MSYINWEKEVSDNSNPTFRLANYQRFFEWKAKDVKSLIDSISREVFIGSGTYFKTEEGEYEVVDGQQRMTTLALIFGRVKTIKFKFNTSGTYREAIQAIIHYRETAVHQKVINESAYLQKIIEMRGVVEDTLKSKKIDVDSLLKNVYFPLTEIPNPKTIYETFRKVNNTGKKVGVSSTFKAYMIENTPKGEINTINNQWFHAIDNIHWINANTIHNAKIDDIFLQSHNSIAIKKFKIGKTKRKFTKGYILENEAELFKEFTSWARKVLISKNKTKLMNIKETETFGIISLNGKINPENIISYYKFLFYFGAKTRDANIHVLYGLILNMYVCSDEIDKKKYSGFLDEINVLIDQIVDRTYKSEIIGLSKKAIAEKDMRSLKISKSDTQSVEDKLLEIVISIAEMWSGKFKPEYSENIKFWYSDKKQPIDSSFRVSKNALVHSYIIKSILFEISSILRYSKFKEGDSEEDQDILKEFVDKGTMSPGLDALSIIELLEKYTFVKINQRNLTVEHLLNKKSPWIDKLDFVTDKAQKLLADKKIEKKIYIIKSDLTDKDIIERDRFQLRHLTLKGEGNEERD